jgi:hypothetical protein
MVVYKTIEGAVSLPRHVPNVHPVTCRRLCSMITSSPLLTAGFSLGHESMTMKWSSRRADAITNPAKLSPGTLHLMVRTWSYLRLVISSSSCTRRNWRRWHALEREEAMDTHRFGCVCHPRSHSTFGAVLYIARQNPASVEQDIDESDERGPTCLSISSHPSSFKDRKFPGSICNLLRPSSVSFVIFWFLAKKSPNLRGTIVQFSGELRLRGSVSSMLALHVWVE